MTRTIITILLLVLATAAAPVLAQQEGEGPTVFGLSYMAPAEIDAYRNEYRQLRTEQERLAFEERHRVQIMARIENDPLNGFHGMTDLQREHFRQQVRELQDDHALNQFLNYHQARMAQRPHRPGPDAERQQQRQSGKKGARG